MKESSHIHVIGSINVDFVIKTKYLPRAGETITGGDYQTVPGGKGANQALAARTLGAAVSMNGCVGNDSLADLAVSNLMAQQIDLSGVHRLDGEATGAAFINLADDGENQIAVASGANHAFAAEHIVPFDATIVIGQLEIPEDVLLRAVEHSSAKFCLNTAPALPISDKLLNRADILVMNEIESDFYAKQISKFDGLIVRTLGSKGAVMSDKNGELAKATPPKVSVIDTTGAGDCFTAALCVAIASGMNHQDALQFACTAGAIATTALGAQGAMPTRDQVDALL